MSQLPETPTCILAPNGNMPLNIVRVTDCALKALSVALLWINLPYGRWAPGKSVAMHANLKILLVSTAATYVLHALTFMCLHAARQLKYLFPVDGCVLPWVLWQCFLLRGLRFGSILGLTFSHAGIFVERAIATFYADNYERIGCTIGFAITAVSWAAVFGWTTYAFGGEDFSSKLSDCVFSQRTQSSMDNAMTVCLAVDVMVSLCDFGLITVNAKQLKRRLPNYSLRRSYQLKENRVTTRIIFPCSLLHTVLFSVYLGTYGNVYRFASALLNRTLIIECTHFAMSAYMCLSLTFFYYIRRKISVCSSEAVVPSQSVDAYFESFERQIAFKPLESNGDRKRC